MFADRNAPSSLTLFFNIESVAERKENCFKSFQIISLQTLSYQFIFWPLCLCVRVSLIIHYGKAAFRPS